MISFYSKQFRMKCFQNFEFLEALCPFRRRSIPFIVLAICCIGFFPFKEYAHATKDQDIFLSKVSSRLFEFNSFQVQVGENISINDFEIKNLNSGKIIYKNGKFEGGIKNEYGHCLFELYYKGKLVYEMGHLKYNNWHTHDYVLEIQYDNEVIDATLSIEGPDGYRDFFIKNLKKVD